MQAQAAAHPATPESGFSVVGPRLEAAARAALARFDDAIQSLLDNPLDATRVREWTRLRTLNV